MEVKLLDRVRGAIRTRHYRRRTEEAYACWIRRYIVFHGKKHPTTMEAEEIEAFLTWLATMQQVSASTQNQARVPVVLSHDEVRAVLQQLEGVAWLVVALLHGCAGLRLQECLELRAKDVDFDRSEIVVRRGKGQTDRRTMLPGAVKERLRAHLGEVRRQHEQDLAAGHRRVALPDALARKYPNAATEWSWQFVFSAGRVCRDPKWGPPSRYHLHESAVQRAVTAAVRKAGIARRAGCYTFRRSFATHLLEKAWTTATYIRLRLSGEA